MKVTSEEKHALLRALPKLFASWDLADEQSSALLSVSKESWERIRSGVNDEYIADDQGQRAGALLGIHAALRTIFVGSRYNDWIQRPNSDLMFSGQSALDFMIAGGLPAIDRVREYLQAEVAR